MTGVLDTIGATTTGMQLLLLAWLLSGQLLVLSFVIPQIAEGLSATVLIFAAITFIGSGLVYLALLPFEPERSAASG